MIQIKDKNQRYYDLINRIEAYQKKLQYLRNQQYNYA